jgi:hypothetical protein
MNRSKLAKVKLRDQALTPSSSRNALGLAMTNENPGGATLAGQDASPIEDAKWVNAAR